MTRVLYLLLALSAFALSGCIVVPLPHVTQRSPHLHGMVVDEISGLPVKDATIQLSAAHQGQTRDYASWNTEQQSGPAPTAKTRPDGQFDVGAKYNFHLLWYANPSFQFHVPSGNYWLGRLFISHEGYQTLSLSGVKKGELGELTLTPKELLP